MNEPNFKRISAAEAKKLIDQGAALADIRDPDSFARGHITGACHLSNFNVHEFIEEQDPDRPLVVYCYHGNSSQPAAQFLYEKGFDEVYSLDGGFEHWQQHFPETIKRD